MKAYRFTVIMLLTVLAAACGKEEAVDGRLRLFAEEMTAATGSSKLLVDPADLTSQWLTGERINVGGSAYSIVKEDGNYYLGGSSVNLSASLYAIYPATVKDALGNDIVVTNNSAGACAIDIHSLAVNFTGDGRHEVIFPMAAHYTTDSSGLMFRHLTGGLKLTLTNSTSGEITVDRLVITATQDGGSAAIYKDLRPAWAASQLPGIPGGEVGEETGSQGAQFISDITLKLNTNGTAGVTIPGQGITFCVPMLAKDLKTLTVTGYHGGTQVFLKSKTLTTATNIQSNVMYTIPTIGIN